MHCLIIGAGLAGLTCARILNQRGIRVTLIEASDGPGGRVRSDYQNGFTFDRGFQVLFDAYPAAQRQLDLAALDLRAFDPGAIICRGGQRSILTDPLRDSDPEAKLEAALSDEIPQLDKLRTLLLALELRRNSIDAILAGEDEPTVSYLRGRGFNKRTIDRFFRPFYGGIFLDRSLETSAKCFRFDFKMLAEGRTTLPAKGMGQIAKQLAAPLVERGLVQYKTKAEQLIDEDGSVRGAKLANGEDIHADAVVLAVPAPEAARLSGLPTPEAALGTTTLYFSGTKPVYEGKKLALNAEPNALVNNAAMITNVVPEYAPAGKHLLSASILSVPTLSDAELFRAALSDIHRMFEGNIIAQAALAQYQPLRMYRIPYSQFRQPPGIHPRLPDNHSGRPGLFFAAEFTEASSLNAAMVSGEKCAEQILQIL